jgi:hypothetical protein
MKIPKRSYNSSKSAVKRALLVVMYTTFDDNIQVCTSIVIGTVMQSVGVPYHVLTTGNRAVVNLGLV